MIDFKKLLDAVTAGLGQPGQHRREPPATAGMEVESAGQAPEQFLQGARDLASRHPGLAQAALLGLAGLMVGGKRRGLAGNLVRLGGLAVIGGLAYKALQPRPTGSLVSAGDTAGGGKAQPGADPAGPPAEGAERPPFHPVSYTEDDAMLFLRAMVAAAASDGRIDEAERARIVKGLTEAGIDPQASRWLDEEMASPADVDELAESVNDPEMAAQVYAAACIAVDPDTVQERDFLHRLSEALDLDPILRAQIDETTDSLR